MILEVLALRHLVLCSHWTLSRYSSKVLLVAWLRLETTWRPRSAVVTGSPCVSTIIARRSWESLHYDPVCFADTGSFSSGSARFGLLFCCARRPFGGHLEGTWRSLEGHLEAIGKLLGGHLEAQWAHEGPSCAPRGSKLSSRGAPEAPRGAQEAPSWLQEAPKRLQVGSQRRPRGSK